jgi:ribokinase
MTDDSLEKFLSKEAKMKNSILVIGSLNYDLVVSVDHLPVPGETIIGGSLKMYPGGKGANQAVACARMGGKVGMIGHVGKDGYGDALINTLRNDGIDPRWISREGDEATGVAMITVDKAGMNTIVVASGANNLVSPQEVRRSMEAFNDAGVLVMQLEIPVDAVQEGMWVAKAKGIKIILNPAPVRDLPVDLLSSVDYLIPNQTELFMLSGEKEVESGIEYLLKLGVETVIVTLGGDGVLMAKKGFRKRFQAFKVDAIDTVAAGDAFVGAFAVALLEGKQVEQAVILANAAAAISVTRHGAQPSLPTRTEVETFLNVHK